MRVLRYVNRYTSSKPKKDIKQRDFIVIMSGFFMSGKVDVADLEFRIE